MLLFGDPVSLPDAAKLAHEDRSQFQWWVLGLVGARLALHRSSTPIRLPPRGPRNWLRLPSPEAGLWLGLAEAQAQADCWTFWYGTSLLA